MKHLRHQLCENRMHRHATRSSCRDFAAEPIFPVFLTARPRGTAQMNCLGASNSFAATTEVILAEGGSFELVADHLAATRARGP